MPSRFPRGATVYDKHGRSYVVEEVEAGTVFCSADNGAEMDFPESALTLDPPGGARAVVYHSDQEEDVGDFRRGEPKAGGQAIARPAVQAPPRPGSRQVAGPKRELSYARVRSSRHYIPPKEKLDRANCQILLGKLNRLSPSLLDFAAVFTATRALEDLKEQELIPALSIVKCREVWESAPIEARAALMAELLGTPPRVLVGMSNVGDFLLTAMIEKGLALHGDAYTSFSRRPRN